MGKKTIAQINLPRAGGPCSARRAFLINLIDAFKRGRNLERFGKEGNTLGIAWHDFASGMLGLIVASAQSAGPGSARGASSYLAQPIEQIDSKSWPPDESSPHLQIQTFRPAPVLFGAPVSAAILEFYGSTRYGARLLFAFKRPDGDAIISKYFNEEEEAEDLERAGNKRPCLYS